MNKPRILMIDIETAPHKVYAWGLWGQDIHLNQIEEPGYTLCWAAQWYGEGKMLFEKCIDLKTGKSTASEMFKKVYALLNEADIVVHFYGKKFDIPVLNMEFAARGWPPPSPFKQIDLHHTAKRRFHLPSNKMDYVAAHFGLEGKLSHKGMALWRGCMANEPASWKTMEAYNKQDVSVLGALYPAMLPWIIGHPNLALYDEDTTDPMCPKCGSTDLQRRGYYQAKTLRYQKLFCKRCGAWSRSRTHDTPKAKRKGTLVTIDE